MNKTQTILEIVRLNLASRNLDLQQQLEDTLKHDGTAADIASRVEYLIHDLVISDAKMARFKALTTPAQEAQPNTDTENQTQDNG